MWGGIIATLEVGLHGRTRRRAAACTRRLFQRKGYGSGPSLRRLSEGSGRLRPIPSTTPLKVPLPADPTPPASAAASELPSGRCEEGCRIAAGPRHVASRPCPFTARPHVGTAHRPRLPFRHAGPLPASVIRRGRPLPARSGRSREAERRTGGRAAVIPLRGQDAWAGRAVPARAARGPGGRDGMPSVLMAPTGGSVGPAYQPVNTREPRRRICPPMIARWISEVPSQIRSTLTSR